MLGDSDTQSNYTPGIDNILGTIPHLSPTEVTPFKGYCIRPGRLERRHLRGRERGEKSRGDSFVLGVSTVLVHDWT